MTDHFEFDLPALKNIFQHGVDLGLCGLHGCLSEVTVGSNVLVAARAGYFGGVDGVVGPLDLGSAFLAVERN